MELGEVIRMAVLRAGGNQADLARFVGTSQSVVSRWVSGQSKPDFEGCLALAEITELPVRPILKAAGHDPRRLNVIEPDGEVSMRIPILARIRSLDEEYRRWMAVMGPRVGEDEAERLFWDARVRDARRHVDDVEAALRPVTSESDGDNPGPDPGLSVRNPFPVEGAECELEALAA